MLKSLSIFAANTPSSFLYVRKSSSYFYGYKNAVVCKDKRLSIHNGLLHSCCNLNLAVRGAIAYFILYTLIFCYMPSSTKNYSSTNNSNANVTSTSTTTESTYFLTQYYQNNLLESVEKLFVNVDISLIADHLSDLMFHATNPESFKDLDKDEIVNLVNDQMSILSCFAEAYMHFQEYYSYKKETEQ